MRPDLPDQAGERSSFLRAGFYQLRCNVSIPLSEFHDDESQRVPTLFIRAILARLIHALLSPDEKIRGQRSITPLNHRG
jgi:hypothetical protein